MDPAQFQKIKEAFARQGKTITTEEDALRYLDFKGAEGATLNAETILLRPGASPSTVFEELIHSAQFRTGRLEEWTKLYGNSNAVRKAEYEAATKLVANQAKYGISDAEHAINLQRMHEFEVELLERGVPLD